MPGEDKEGGEENGPSSSVTNQDVHGDIRARLRELEQKNERLNDEIRRLEQAQDGHSDGHSEKRDDVPPDPRDVFRSVYQSLQTPAFLVDVQHDADGYGFSVLTTNDAFQEKLSDRTVDVQGKNPLFLSNEQDRACIETQFCRCVRQEERRVFEMDVQRNGLQGRFEVSLIPCSNEEGVEAIIGLMEREPDHGERNGNREESQERLRERSKATEHSPIGVVMTDATAEDNPIFYMNDAFERLTGYSGEEVMGRNCRFLQGKETDPEVVERIREAVDHQDPITVEIRNYRKNGEMFWNQLMIPPVRNDSGEVTRYLGYQRDVTRWMEYERELELFRESIERSPDSLFIVDPESAEFIDVNHTAVREHGYTREELVELGPHDINPHFGEDLDWSDHLQELQESGPLTIESEHRRKDGSLFPVEVHVNYLDLDGESRVVAMARDITERKRARRKIEEQANFLQMINDQLPGVTYQMRTTDDDPPFEFTYLSKGFYELAGVSSEAVQQDPECLTSLIQPGDRYALGEALVTSQQELSPLRKEFRISHPEQGERWLQTRAEPEEQPDGQVLWTGVMIDVTENRRNLRRRKEQERRFRTLFDNAPIGLWEEDWLVHGEGPNQ